MNKFFNLLKDKCSKFLHSKFGKRLIITILILLIAVFIIKLVAENIVSNKIEEEIIKGCNELDNCEQYEDSESGRMIFEYEVDDDFILDLSYEDLYIKLYLGDSFLMINNLKIEPKLSESSSAPLEIQKIFNDGIGSLEISKIEINSSNDQIWNLKDQIESGNVDNISFTDLNISFDDVVYQMKELIPGMPACKISMGNFTFNYLGDIPSNISNFYEMDENEGLAFIRHVVTNNQELSFSFSKLKLENFEIEIPEFDKIMNKEELIEEAGLNKGWVSLLDNIEDFEFSFLVNFNKYVSRSPDSSFCKW